MRHSSATAAATDAQFMDLAVGAARKAPGDATTPRVGALAVLNGEHLATAFRSEVEPGEHAEFTLLERHLKDTCLVGATVFTTLEPCTKRNPPKRACFERLIQRKVGRVVVGMLDPNPLVSGLGCRLLRQANITVDLFPCEVMSQLEDLNRDFIRHIETNPTHIATMEIADLACRSGIPRQREAVGVTIGDCVAALQRINRGELPVRGREAGYFKRLLEAIDQSDGPEHIRAFIRLTAFKPDELYPASWFERFYEALEDRVHRGCVSIEYVFLVREFPLMKVERDFLARYERFADRVSVTHQHDPRLSPDLLRPSVVLLDRQRLAFTHDRGEDSVLLDATEWVSPGHFAELDGKYRRIEVMSKPHFQRGSNPRS